MTLEIGQLIHHDRYRIDALLGRGGMGAVYKAWDSSLELNVAIKENLDISPEAQKQFNREASILARLSHPNLPRVTDYFLIPDQGQYLVMDYIEGLDLQTMLDQLERLPAPEVLNWISQICDAVAYLHSQPTPIIHRDIKPANIKITPDGRAVLVDFGIAKLHSPSKATTVGAKAVTPGYSPPEQYGDHVHTDARSDIYALGATLYHLLTGKEPPESVLRVVNRDLMPPPRALNPELNPDLEGVIVRSTELSTERRYQSVGEMQAALRNMAAGLVSAAASSAEPEHTVEGAKEAGQQEMVRPTAGRESSSAAEAVLVAPPMGVKPPAGGRPLPPPAMPPAAEMQQPATPSGSATHPRKGVPIWVWLGAGFLVLCVVAAGLGTLVYRQMAVRLEATATLPATVTLPPASATFTFVPPTATQAMEPTATLTLSPAVSAGSPSGYEPVASLVAPLDQDLRSVAEKDGFVYLLTKKNRLLVYDLRNLDDQSGFTILTEFTQNLPVKNGNGLLRLGDLLYAYGNAGIQILDISDPSQPIVKREQVDLMIYGVLVQDNLLIATGAEKFQIYDISSPTSPVTVGKYTTGANTVNYSALLNRGYLFIAQYATANERPRGYLLAFDFSDPKNPRQVQKIDANEVGFHLFLQDNFIIRCTYNDVEVWELGQPDYPRFRFAERGQALGCVNDRGNILGNGMALRVEANGISVLSTFDPYLQPGELTDSRLKAVETVPYHSYAGGQYVFLVQQSRVLVLKPIW